MSGRWKGRETESTELEKVGRVTGLVDLASIGQVSGRQLSERIGECEVFREQDYWILIC